MRVGFEVAERRGAMVVAKNRVRRKAVRVADQRGISSVEYALLALGVIAVFGVVIVLLEGGVLGLLDQVSDQITAAASS